MKHPILGALLGALVSLPFQSANEPPAGDPIQRTPSAAPELGLDPLHREEQLAREALLAANPSAALHHLDRASTYLLGPPPPEWNGLRALALSALGRAEEALAAAEAPAGSSLVAELEAARALVRLNRESEAAARLDALLARYPNYGHALAERAALFEREGNREAAQAAYARLAEQAPSESFAIARLARAEFESGQREAGIERLRAALGEGREPAAPPRPVPAPSVLRETLVELLLAHGQAPEAAAVAEALVGPHGSAAAQSLAARAGREGGALLLALRAAVHQLEADPRDPAPLDHLSALLLDTAALDIAVAEARVARSADADSHRLYGHALLRAGRADQALAFAEGLAPADRGPLLYLEARALRTLGRAAEARERLLLADPADGEAAYELGIAEMELGNAQASQNAFLRAAQAAGGDASLAAAAHEARATLFERNQRFTDAAAALDEALLADPNRPATWLRLARLARLRLGDRERATLAYGRFFALGGEDADGRRYVESAAARPR